MYSYMLATELLTVKYFKFFRLLTGRSKYKTKRWIVSYTHIRNNRYVCIYMAESLCCPPETATLLINYTPI